MLSLIRINGRAAMCTDPRRGAAMRTQAGGVDEAVLMEAEAEGEEAQRAQRVLQQAEQAEASAARVAQASSEAGGVVAAAATGKRRRSDGDGGGEHPGPSAGAGPSNAGAGGAGPSAAAAAAAEPASDAPETEDGREALLALKEAHARHRAWRRLELNALGLLAHVLSSLPSDKARPPLRSARRATLHAAAALHSAADCSHCGARLASPPR